MLIELLAYVVASRFVIRNMTGRWREIGFATLNLSAMYVLLFYGHKSHYDTRFACYLALILIQYLMVRFFSQRTDWTPWLAFFTPIAALIVIHYIPGALYIRLSHAFGTVWRGVPDMMGISYLAFRSSRLVLEVRNGSVKRPDFWEYLNFCFFLPTMPVGPINTYANYRLGFDPVPFNFPVGRSAMRILVGFIKFQYLGNLCNELTYSNLLLDDHPHRWVDLPIAALFYYLYLYCNFSGFCDMAIGAAGLIGIPVPENFDNPFAARNVRDFWNRWHITLSQYMRDVLFAPLSKFLVRLMGPGQVNQAIALTITIVFLLIGIWHGLGWNFAAYGAVHAFAVVTNHYYTLFLKNRLGRDGFKAYTENPWIRGVATVMTFCYCGASLFLFANTFPEMREILASLR